MAYISKKQRAAQMAYLDQEPVNIYLTPKEIAAKFPDLPSSAIPEEGSGTKVFMWNDSIITVKFSHKPVFDHYNNLKNYHNNGNN